MMIKDSFKEITLTAEETLDVICKIEVARTALIRSRCTMIRTIKEKEGLSEILSLLRGKINEQLAINKSEIESKTPSGVDESSKVWSCAVEVGRYKNEAVVMYRKSKTHIAFHGMLGWHGNLTLNKPEE